MAKKSAGSLNTGADATIVAAAYRAGMAGVPKDLSKTFQGIATGYTKAMEKMGAGLAKAAEVGTSIAAPLIEQSIQNYKTMTSDASSISSEDYGQSFIDSIYGVNGEGGFLNELKEEKQAWKDMSGPERKEAKRKWKQKRDKGFAHIRQLQKGEFLNTSLIAEGDWNPNATGSENALLHSAIQAKGKPLPEGHPYAGVSVKSVIGEDGGISLELTKDGKSVSGLNDDGSLRYGGALSTMAPKKKETSGVLSTNKPDKSKTKEIQRQLQNQGYDISYTNKQGKVISGEDAIDGDWGKSTQDAWSKFKKDQEEKGQVMTGGFGPGSVVEKPLTVTPENIEKLIVPKDYKMRENLTKIDLNELNNGIKGFDFRENDIKRQIGEQIKTTAQLKDAMHAPLANMDGTYADYLGQPNEWTQEMYGVLENMSGIQDIGKPGIDADDFAGEQGAANMAVLRKEMLNANNPASKKMFVDWYTEGIRESHTAGKATYDKNLRAKTKGNKTTSGFSFDSGTNPLTGGSQVSGQDRNLKRQKILQGENFMGQVASWQYDSKTGLYSGSNFFDVDEKGDKSSRYFNKQYTIDQVMEFENVGRPGDPGTYGYKIGEVKRIKGKDGETTNYIYIGRGQWRKTAGG